MGITDFSLAWLTRRLPPAPFRMLELGNQHLFLNGQPVRPAKPHFVAMGIDHVSIDLNGEDGAYPYDLNEPESEWSLTLNDPYIDVATDFGTSEHVVDLWQCLENVHRLTRPEALVFHANPAPGNWPDHGLHHRGVDFYAAFAEMAYYRIVECFKHPALGNTETGWETYCLMIRGTKSFPRREEFAELPVHAK